LGGGVMLALGAIGLGLKAFSWGLKSVNEINGEQLSEVGAGLKDLTTGVLAFSVAAGANILGAMANGIAGLFGADITTRIKRAIEELAPIAPQLSIIGPAMRDFGEGLKFFGEAFGSLRGIGAREMQTIFATISNSGLNNLASMGQGMLNFGTGLKSFAEALKSIDVDHLKQVMENLRRITPEDIRRFQTLGANPQSMAQPTQTLINPAQQVSQALTQPADNQTRANQTQQTLPQEDSPAARAILTYLSNIATDINAIRGNTRPESAITPVRLG